MAEAATRPAAPAAPVKDKWVKVRAMVGSGGVWYGERIELPPPVGGIHDTHKKYEETEVFLMKECDVKELAEERRIQYPVGREIDAHGKPLRTAVLISRPKVERVPEETPIGIPAKPAAKKSPFRGRR